MVTLTSFNFPFNMQYKIIFILLSITQIGIAVEPVTIGMALAAAAFGGFEYFKDKTYCRFRECCTDEYIPINIECKLKPYLALRIDLHQNLYGQHIADNTVVSSLYSHYKYVEKSEKPLVITFHGTTGTGKNFVADLIVKHLYKNGHNSKYVHKYMGRMHFPEDGKVDFYREQLKSDILSAVRKCEKSIFIFDEVDKIPKGVLDVLTPILDYNNSLFGINFRKCIFIFLTNTGGDKVAFKLSEIMKSGTLRESVKLKQFENFCQLEAFNLNGGLKQIGAIESSLIDHYIPFLPLERQHVEMCIKKEFLKLDYRFDEEDVQEVYDEIIMDDSTTLFVLAGCKRVTKKVESRVASKTM